MGRRPMPTALEIFVDAERVPTAVESGVERQAVDRRPVPTAVEFFVEVEPVPTLSRAWWVQCLP